MILGQTSRDLQNPSNGITIYNVTFVAKDKNLRLHRFSDASDYVDDIRIVIRIYTSRTGVFVRRLIAACNFDAPGFAIQHYTGRGSGIWIRHKFSLAA